MPFRFYVIIIRHNVTRHTFIFFDAISISIFFAFSLLAATIFSAYAFRLLPQPLQPSSLPDCLTLSFHFFFMSSSLPTTTLSPVYARLSIDFIIVSI